MGIEVVMSDPKIEYGTARRTADGVLWDAWVLGDDPPTAELLATWRAEDDPDVDEIVVVHRFKQTEWVLDPACESAGTNE